MSTNDNRQQSSPQPESSAALVPREYNGVIIPQRRSDRYINATRMCQAAGKRWDNYRTHAGYKPYVEALSRSLNLSERELVHSIQGGPPAEQGTWVHPRVAVHLAQWCNPEFAVMVSGWVEELLMTSQVHLKRLTPIQILAAQSQVLVEMEERHRQTEMRVSGVELRLTETEERQRSGERQVEVVDERVDQIALDLDETDRKVESVRDQLFGKNRCYAVSAYAIGRGWQMSRSEASAHGKKLTALCDERGIKYGETADERFHTVHTYPEALLDEYFEVAGENEEIPD